MNVIEINKHVISFLILSIPFGGIAIIYDHLFNYNSFSYYISVIIAVSILMVYYNLHIQFKTTKKRN